MGEFKPIKRVDTPIVEVDEASDEVSVRFRISGYADHEWKRLLVRVASEPGALGTARGPWVSIRTRDTHPGRIPSAGCHIKSDSDLPAAVAEMDLLLGRVNDLYLSEVVPRIQEQAERARREAEQLAERQAQLKATAQTLHPPE